MKELSPLKTVNNLLSNGYLRVGLSKDDVSVSITIHRLVASAFIENRDNKPFVNHIDGNKQNNHVNNLEWCTPKENGTHASKNNLYKSAKGSTHYRTSLTDSIVLNIRELAKTNSAAQIARDLNLSYAMVCQIVSRRRWAHI